MTKSILQMDPTPNFGVFLDFEHAFLTEVDFTCCMYVIVLIAIDLQNIACL